MKRFIPFISLLFITVVAGALMLTLGGAFLCQPDHDPAKVRAGELLSYLRDGQSFSLSQVYPGAWDSVQFSPSLDSLSATELRALYRYSEAFMTQGAPMLLFWRDGELTDALPLSVETAGYPRFTGRLMEDGFLLSREEATFMATFVPGENGRGGYYQCVPEGRAL